MPKPICQKHHPNYDKGCFRCKLVSFQLAPSATPSRGKALIEGDLKEEKRRKKDLPAYERMRKAGVQPASTLDAHKMESEASTAWEIEHNRILGPELAEKVETTERELRQEGVI
jgi:hypothetical protein